jgi:hypothetical protein
VYIGHVGAGLAAKAAASRSRPRGDASLGTFVFAALLCDLMFGPLVLLGVEHLRLAPGITAVAPFDLYDYPWSHSLLMVAVWAAVVSGVHYARRASLTAVGWLGAAVLSHWLLDFVSHRPDMPIGLGGPYVGLGLWNSKPATAFVEGALFVLCVLAYVGSTRRTDSVGRWALVGFVFFLLATWAPLFFSPPPANAEVVAWTNFGGWLLVAWAAWIDRHRRAIA